jgi:hypothetical protein
MCIVFSCFFRLFDPNHERSAKHSLTDTDIIGFCSLSSARIVTFVTMCCAFGFSVSVEGRNAPKGNVETTMVKE